MTRSKHTSMKLIIRRCFWYPIYPWLLGIFPVLYLYSANYGLVRDWEVAYALIAMLVGTTIAFGLIHRFTDNIHTAAIILGICSACFSLSGHVYTLVFMPRSLAIWTLCTMLAVTGIVFKLLKTRSKTFSPGLTVVLNLIILGLILPQCISILSQHHARSNYADLETAFLDTYEEADFAEKAYDSPSTPDIYFVVPDGYPSDSWLQEAMDFDNSEFTSELRDRGFVVADYAQSNYGKTLTSLAAVLNMQPYDSNRSPLTDLDYLHLDIVNSEVARLLLSRGYTYIHFLNGFLLPSPIADINRDFAPAGVTDFTVEKGELPSQTAWRSAADSSKRTQFGKKQLRPFFSLYVDTTLLRLARSLLSRVWEFVDTTEPYGWKAPELFLATTAEAARIAAMPEATFTFAHLMKPHGPVVFNQRGEAIAETFAPTPEQFFAELRFVNARLLDMIDQIMQISNNPPLIILLADHGTTFGELKARRGVDFDWATAHLGEYTHFDIYAAFYIPEPFELDLPRPFTSVNTFPLVFNAVFDTNLALHEDRLFELTRGYSEPFTQRDVTETYLLD